MLFNVAFIIHERSCIDKCLKIMRGIEVIYISAMLSLKLFRNAFAARER